MCMITFMNVHSPSYGVDCSYMQSLLAFVAWTQLNPYAIETARSLGYTALPFGFKT